MKITGEVQQAVIDAAKYIKKCDYKGTAIKVELEAQLNRSRDNEEEYCDDCGGDGYIVCESCDGGEVLTDVEGQEDVWVECGDCEGSYRHDCDNCSGTGIISEVSDIDWSDDYCKEWLLEHVSDEAREALIYGKFYYDGSVDSEFTFTVPIDKPFVIVEYIEAFKKMADEYR